MENASKALIMAGGILIALLVLGALMLMVNNLSSYQDSQDIQTKSSQIAEFNNQFNPYIKSDISMMELKTLYNKIKNNNIVHPEWYINNNFNNLQINFDTIDSTDKSTRSFRSTKVEYNNSEGRISCMEFEENK